MNDEEYKAGREFPNVNKGCYQESQAIVAQVLQAIEIMFATKVDNHWALGEAHMRIALRRLLENVLKPGIITTEMEIEKNRWDLQVQYTFCMLGRDTLVRSTSCVNVAKPRPAAQDLCISTVACVESAKRDFMNKWLNSDDYSDFVHALSFACDVGNWSYL